MRAPRLIGSVLFYCLETFMMTQARLQQIVPILAVVLPLQDRSVHLDEACQLLRIVMPTSGMQILS